MHPGEVVKHIEQRQRVAMAFDPPGEAIRQPCEPAHGHPHREVLTLDKRRANMVRVWLAGNGALICAKADAGAVAASAGRVAIYFDQPGEVDIGAERTFNGFWVGSVAIRGQLHAGR